MANDFKVFMKTSKYLQLNAVQLIALLKNPFLNIRPNEEIPLIQKWLSVIILL